MLRTETVLVVLGSLQKEHEQSLLNKQVNRTFWSQSLLLHCFPSLFESLSRFSSIRTQICKYKPNKSFVLQDAFGHDVSSQDL